MAIGSSNSSKAMNMIIVLMMLLLNMEEAIIVPVVALEHHISVAKTGPADFSSINAALAYINASLTATNNTDYSRIFVNIGPGIYREKVVVSSKLERITFQGAGARQTFIRWGDSLKSVARLTDTATLQVEGEGFVCRDMTIQNTYPVLLPKNLSQAVALATNADMVAFYNVRILSYQDTLFDVDGRHYYENCYIGGSVDFICGPGRALFNNCTLASRSRYPAGSITAQQRYDVKNNSGFVFRDCRIVRYSPVYKGTVMLGRAWGQSAMVIFYNTYMDDVIYSPAWDLWHGNPSKVIFQEINSWGPGAASLRPSIVNIASIPAVDVGLGFIDGKSWL